MNNKKIEKISEKTEEIIEEINYFSQLISQNRLNRFEEVLLERTRTLCVVLENIYQPHNASAVLRTCDAFGIQDVHVIERSYKFKPASGVTMGAEQWLSVERYQEHSPTSFEAGTSCIQKLRQKGYQIICTSPHPSQDEKNFDLCDFLPTQKTAFVIGSEKEGLSKEIQAKADGFVRIPMLGFSESFNLSVCAALVLYDQTQKLKKSKINWSLTDQEKKELFLQWIKKSIREVHLIEKNFEKVKKKSQ